MSNSDQHIELIIRHLSGEATPKEEQLLSNWLIENELNQKQFNETKSAWELANDKLDPEAAMIDVDDEWNKISSELNFEEKNKLIALKPKTSFNWVKIAATILVLITLAGGWYLLKQPKETILVASNKIIENKMPDGSNITLKEKSSIAYDEEYNQQIRKVVLKGEAFFEVEPNKEKPFIVEAGKIIVKVLGTSFIVKNSEQNELSEVIVSEGTVLVYNAKNKQDSVIITAGEKVSFREKSTTLKIDKNQDKNFMAWKTKNFTFDNTSLSEVVKTINHAFNANIILRNKNLSNCTWTVSLQNQSLESVLKVLEVTLNIKAKKTGKKIELIGQGCENIQKK